MQRTGVSAVTAYTAHREWATRPPDERFASVSALYEAARVRRARTEERTIETHQVRTAAETDDDLVVIIWGFRHVAGFRRRHVGASIHAAWTDSLESVRTALDASMADDRTLLLRATTQELGPTRDAVLDTVTTRVELSRKQAVDAYGLAEQFETNPRSVWGYVQGLTRLSQRTPWQDQRFALDRAASRLLTTVH
jgi:hypothetical protein